MRTWQRSRRRLVCGRCCAAIAIGDPLLVLESPDHTWKKARCQACAGEPVPELPALEAATPQLLGTTVPGFVKVGRIPFDYKQAQAGRDPGEEG